MEYRQEEVLDCYRIAMVVSVSSYKNLREQGFVGFYDIDETEDDHEIQAEGVTHLNFNKIYNLREPKRSNVHEAMLEIRQKIEENRNEGKLTYVYFYYGGAGAND